jgi:hypothetical protein
MLSLLEIRQSGTRLASFFGEGMTRASGQIAADVAQLRELSGIFDHGRFCWWQRG